MCCHLSNHWLKTFVEPGRELRSHAGTGGPPRSTQKYVPGSDHFRRITWNRSSAFRHASFVTGNLASRRPSRHSETERLWGIAMGMQSAAVRTLHVEGVFTTAATAIII